MHYDVSDTFLTFFQPVQLTIFREDNWIDKIIFNPVYHLQ